MATSATVPLMGLTPAEMAALSGHTANLGGGHLQAAVLSFLKMNPVRSTEPASGWHGLEGICRGLKAKGVQCSEHEAEHELLHRGGGGLIGLGHVERRKQRVFIPSIGMFRHTWAYHAL